MGSSPPQISWKKLPTPDFPLCCQLPVQGQVTTRPTLTQIQTHTRECPEPCLRQEKTKEKQGHALIQQIFMKLPLRELRSARRRHCPCCHRSHRPGSPRRSHDTDELIENLESGPASLPSLKLRTLRPGEGQGPGKAPRELRSHVPVPALGSLASPETSLSP